jgi:hypothetical protein
MRYRNTRVALTLISTALFAAPTHAQVAVGGYIDDSYSIPHHLAEYFITFPGPLQHAVNFDDFRPDIPGYPSRHATALSGGGRGFVTAYDFAQYIQNVSTNDPGGYTMNSVSNVVATWNDVRVTGPAGPPMVPVSINLLVHGSFDFQASNVNDPFHVGWQQYSSASFLLRINGDFGAAGNWGVRSDSSGPILHPLGDGIFTDFNGTFEGPSETVMVPANTPFSVQMTLQVTGQISLPRGGGIIISTSTDFAHTASFATSGPAFNVPPGYTVNSDEAGVTDNSFGICLCDWDHSGDVNSQDFFQFLTDFFAGNADFNSDGTTISQDLFDFLGCFFAGCA